MRPALRKLLIYSAAAVFSLAPAALAQDSTGQGNTDPPAASADSAAAISADTSAADSSATTPAPKTDSAAVKKRPGVINLKSDSLGTEPESPPSAGTTVKPAATAQTAAPARPDSGLKARPDTGAQAARPDTLKAAADTSGTAQRPDSLKAKTAEAAAPPAAKIQRVGEEVEALVIPWDWDEYTNVTELGLRRKDGREYSLTRNEECLKLFKYQGQRVRVWGKIARDDEGFYSLTVNSFEPADSLTTPAAGAKP